MAQVFDNGSDEKIVDKDISGPTEDVYFEVSSRVYFEPTEDVYFEVGDRVYYEDPLTVYQEESCKDLANPVINLGRS